MLFNNLLNALKKIFVPIVEIIIILIHIVVYLLSSLWDWLRILILIIPVFSNVMSMYYVKNPNKFLQANYAYWKTIYVNFKQTIFYLIYSEFDKYGYPNRYNIWHIKIFYQFLCKLWFFAGGKYSWVFNKGVRKWALYFKKNIDELDHLIESCNPYDGSSLQERYERFIKAKAFIRSLPFTATMWLFDCCYFIPFILKIIWFIIYFISLIVNYIFFYDAGLFFVTFCYYCDPTYYNICLECGYTDVHPWIYKYPNDFTVWCYEPAYNGTSWFRDIVTVNAGNQIASMFHKNCSESFMLIADQVLPLYELWWSGRITFFTFINSLSLGYNAEYVSLLLLDFYKFISDLNYCVSGNLTLKDLYWRDIINSYKLTINNLDTSILVIKPSNMVLYIETDYIKILLNNHSTTKYNFNYINYKLSYKTQMNPCEYVYIRWIWDSGYQYINMNKFALWLTKQF